MTRNHTDTEILFDAPSRARRARPSNINYNLLPEDILRIEDQSDDGGPAARPAARGAPRGGAVRGLFNMGGPFGGTSSINRTLPFGPDARNLALMGDDSSDDETPARPPGGLPGLTPLTPHMAAPQPHNTDAGGAMGFGRTTKKDIADITPLAVSPDIDFSSVGGLDDHINKLKEMVMIPLLYPEIFTHFKVPPPRGVLFHGPPGTGKTLLARALASSVSTADKKVTFFMRKGADVMSKWVGEAERQLRLLFEEAKKQQPAIIFFDEFDGLAPVRSSKQEQIHASIVTTLLSLMDGLDSRGQIVVIGATNRPDSIDPAFRRPGRFDREFYFPLPNQAARRAIIDIKTRDWDPPLDAKLKDELAEKTRGYGGSDIQALCAEASINAMQRTYPQIYGSDKKLQIDVKAIRAIAKDFQTSMRNIVPSSERQSTAVAEPLAQKVEPLLRTAMAEIIKKLNETVPRKRKHLTALEEAELEDLNEASGFDAEEMMRTIERGRVFRPRLLIKGQKGMGQKYLASAILQELEGFFVRSLDLATLFGDSANPPEAVLASAFKEARIQQPSILLIPQIDSWYETVGPRIVETFSSLLRTLAANDAVLLLATFEAESVDEEPDPKMMRDLFGFSKKHEYRLDFPNEVSDNLYPISRYVTNMLQQSRFEFFTPLVSYVRKRPSDFTDREDRKKRKLPELPLAKVEVVVKPPPTKAELKAQFKADRSTLNMLRLVLTPVMREVKDKWRAFGKSVIQDRDLEYLALELDPNYVTSDLTEEQRQEQQMLRPFEIGKDDKGRAGLIETATGKFYYNCNTQIVEQRLSNGYYKRAKEFLWDLKSIMNDHKTTANEEKAAKASDMYHYATAETELIEKQNMLLWAEADAVYQREQEREKQMLAESGNVGKFSNVPPPAPDSTVPSGPIQLGGTIGLGIPIPRTPGPRHAGDRPHDSHHTNGETNPSQPTDENTEAMEVDEPSSGSRPQFPAGFTETPSNPTTYQQSQQSGVHKMLPGSHLNDLQNSASTTTSGHKTSERTSRGSDPRPYHQTQSTNGNSTQSDSLPAGWIPDFNSMMPPPDGSQMPDTQSTASKRKTIGATDSSQGDGSHQMSNGNVGPSQEQEGQEFKHPGLPASLQHTQATTTGMSRALPDSMVATAGSVVQGDSASQQQSQPQPQSNGHNDDNIHTAPIADILNPTTPPPPPPPFVLDEAKLADLHQWMAKFTDHLTVEQLEMIDARCVNVVHQNRGLWDRNPVLELLKEAVEEVLEDVAWQGSLNTAVAAAYGME
jgi:SpoVK/Ycf46/Vps4 family AAA+-type ATPase